MRRGAAAIACVMALATVSAAGADPGTTESLTFGAYPYLVYVPTTYDPARPAPLVVMTHGCQTTADQQMRANLYNDVAEREGIVMLYPDVDPMEAAQPGPLERCWQFPSPDDWHRDAGDPAAIAGMTRAVMKRWSVDPERVYMVGMSAGSFMTSIMAAAYPDLYAAVAINAGGAYADGTCLFVPGGLPAATSAQMARDEMGERARVVPRMVMGGDNDQGVPPACADKALEQGLRTNNLVLGDQQDAPLSLRAASTREVPKPGGYATTVSTYMDRAGCVVGERWLIHGMNHFWPGGSTDPKLASFTDPKGPSGAEATWRFLSLYTKRSTAQPCTQAPVTAPCPARRISVRVPARAHRVRVTLDGRRIAFRRTGRRVRVRVTVGALVVHGRASGKRFVRRRAVPACGG